MSTEKSLIRTKEVAHRLGVTPVLIYNWCREAGMPHIRVNKTFLFDWNKVQSWIDSRSRNA